MKIEHYEHEKHVARFAKWLAPHKLTVPDRRLLSDLGFIVDDCAVGFLYTTNSGRAEIDYVAADPAAPQEKRHAALELLFQHLEQLAREKGFVLVTGYSALPTMCRRFESTGFTDHGKHSVFFKVIGG